MEVTGCLQKEGDSSEEIDPFEVEPKILVNALTRDHNFHTMRVVGMINGTRIHILVDSESTNNFLDFSFAKNFGCKIEKVRS